jgi:hypothetical protein
MPAVAPQVLVGALLDAFLEAESAKLSFFRQYGNILADSGSSNERATPSQCGFTSGLLLTVGRHAQRTNFGYR